MKKLFAMTTAAIAAGTSAIAGTVTYVAPEVVTIDPPARMGGSGAWLIPLVIIAVLALALTSSTSEAESEVLASE